MQAYPHKRIGAQAMIGAGYKPSCCPEPRATPWVSDDALIKVSRSVRATCFMRGNAPCGVKGVMGYALSARGIFAQAQKCRMYQSRSTFPQGAALGYGQHLGLQPAPIIYRAFVQIGSFSTVCNTPLLQTYIGVHHFGAPRCPR